MNAFFGRMRDLERIDPDLRFVRNRPSGIPAPDRRDWIIRPDDLLVLDFDLYNLQVEAGKKGGDAHVVRSGRGACYLTVTFPPQNLAERAYFTTVEHYPVSVPPRTEGKDKRESVEDPPDPDEPPYEKDPPDEELELPPIASRLAGWSRLVFRVTDDDLPITWTLDGLLEAMGRLELSVPDNALPPPNPPMILSVAEIENLLAAKLIDEELIKELVPDAVEIVVPTPVVPVSKAGGIINMARARRRVRQLEGRAIGRSGSITRALNTTVERAHAFKGILPLLMRPQPQVPNAYQTALELPYRMIVSPNRFGAWFHTERPFTSPETGHTELWHTRLGVRVGDIDSEGKSFLRSIRAVWAKDYAFDKRPYSDPPGHPHEPFRMSLDRFDRHNIVHLSSNFGILGIFDEDDPSLFFEPPAVDVDFLSLTAMGGWLDSRGVWDFPQPIGLTVEEWRHRATLGRDHYVRVVYAGFLYPWGHRASLIKVSERQFHDDAEERPAYVRQRMYLVVREPLKRYRNTNYRREGNREQFDLMMPFKEVRITTRVSPLLDPPELSQIASGLGQGCFWPLVSGEDFLFDLIASDTAGNDVEFAMPLIFVGKEFTDQNYIDSIVPTDVWGTYEGEALGRAKVNLFGQLVSLAESKTPDDTVVSVESLTFGAEIPDEADYDDEDSEYKFHWQKPRFFPVVRSANVYVPALQGIARTSEPTAMVFAGPYLRAGFGRDDETGESNAGEVFLKYAPGDLEDEVSNVLDVAFSSQGDRTGALLAPDLTMTGLSRLTGPIAGNPDAFAIGDFNPMQWFGDPADLDPGDWPNAVEDVLTGAKLFGVFSLIDILKGAGVDELDAIPRFVGKALNEVDKFITELDRMEKMLLELDVPEAAVVESRLNELLNPDTGSIPALFDGGEVDVVEQDLQDLRLELNDLTAVLDDIDYLTAGPKVMLKKTMETLQMGIDHFEKVSDTLDAFANGDLLPESLDLHFEWRPKIQSFPSDGTKIFIPAGEPHSRNLLLSVHASGDNLRILCSLDDFMIDLYVVILDFEHVQFRVDGGGKPEIDVRLKEPDGFVFAGPLAFVETLRNVIPLDGFSDPPDVSVTAEGIKAGFSMGLPNLAVGVFSLENLSLAAGFSIPFIGPPLSTWFQFCTRENPSRLTVSLFGGGFFFGFTVNPRDLVIVEGAIEFGAAVSVNFGVASGSVSAMAGLYFKLEGTNVTLAGYFRMRGEVSALGIVSVSIELYLEMRYESESGKCVGTATISIEIDITLFSVTIEITATKKFAGANADPTFAEMMEVDTDSMTSEPWTTYCEAFA